MLETSSENILELTENNKNWKKFLQFYFIFKKTDQNAKLTNTKLLFATFYFFLFHVIYT